MKRESGSNLEQKLLKACRYIETAESIPTLSTVAKEVSLSPSHFQKIFKHALSVSPRHYADAIRFNRLRRNLKKGSGVSSALYEAGFGGSSRLYEFTNRYLGMTPKKYQQEGKGLAIAYTITRSPLGLLLVAATEKGVCFVALGDSRKKLEAELKSEFKSADLKEQNKHLHQWTQILIDYLAGHKPWPCLPYDVQATAFQRRVWEWLLTIPPGKTYSYSEAAKAMGYPKATRAVARACATNPVALIIPCHRIVPKSGGIGGYRWNPARKRQLLTLEKANIS